MNTEILSHLKEKVVIECGIWWNPPSNDYPVIIYGGFLDNPKYISLSSWTKQDQGIACCDCWDRDFLCVPVSKSTDIEELLNRVLDELLKQLK